MLIRRWVGLGLSGLAVVGAGLLVVGCASVDAPPETRQQAAAGVRGLGDVYLVQMLERPVVSYEGDVPGYAATKPRRGRKIDPNHPEVVRYAGYLDSRHDAALRQVGGGHRLYDYRYSFNGFAASLTDAQAAQLAQVPGVVAVVKDELRRMETATTPAFLGLSGTAGVWQQQLGGVDRAGEDIIVGVVDSGVWPENPSFSDRTGIGPNDQEGKLAYQQISGWHGKCTPGEAFPASNCGQKLIGAQRFNAGFGGDEGVKVSFDWEFASPRDPDGHGSHTASTAAGNANVPAVVNGALLGNVSGMAPRARIAAYKVCWGGAEGGCFSSDSVAAIDQAVADGVDVINFSISGSQTSFLDPVEVAFLFAADAGVFVAASAGNAGPTASTVAHNSPWLTTVAAGTHDRVYLGQVTLGSGSTYVGASLTAALAASPLILSDGAGLSGANATEVALCYPGTLDPAKVSGKIVVCDRGIIARVDKSLAVKMAGGAGMILVNTSPSTLNADLHHVPTVHLQSTDRAAIRAYAVGAGATASLSAGAGFTGFPAPSIASFSSRGPSRASGSLLKPDIMAPGVDVLAAVSPVSFGHDFDFLSGTSMSSPHMAGLGALMKQKFPSWSPAMIKSAFMTTASQVRNDGTAITGGAFAIGAGHVDPKRAMNPGLVYDAGFTDWLGFLCGTGQLVASYCPAIAIDPSNLNYPSIAVGALSGSKNVTRTVTNVGPTATYTATISGLAGFTATVSPSSFTLSSGQKKMYTLAITRTTAALNTYAEGAITWSDGNGRTVRSPIVIRPVALAAPTSVSGTGGAISYKVDFGYTGSFAAAARGLVPATTTSGTVVDDPGQSFSPGGPGTAAFPFTVPAGTTYVRLSLFDAFTNGNHDLDLYVTNSAGALIAGSGGSTSNEEVNLANLPAGSYTAWVHGYQTDGGSAAFTLFQWTLDAADAGNMTVSAPSAATLGTSATISLTFSGLAPATKYLGSVAYSGTTGMPSPTIVRVDMP